MSGPHLAHLYMKSHAVHDTEGMCVDKAAEASAGVKVRFKTKPLA